MTWQALLQVQVFGTVAAVPVLTNISSLSPGTGNMPLPHYPHLLLRVLGRLQLLLGLPHLPQHVDTLLNEEKPHHGHHCNTAKPHCLLMLVSVVCVMMVMT